MGSGSTAAPCNYGTHMGHFSSLPLVAHLFKKRIEPEVRLEAQGRSIKTKMRKRVGD